ncbi:MAG: hypothetical protein M1531_09120 [Chloroflexi bacterium]|nr:hypothetical protein [Chloroflexota bacterium]
MTTPKNRPPSAATPFPSLGAPPPPGPQAPQILTVAMLSAAQDGCQCDACKLLRRMVSQMKEDLIGATNT